MSTDSREPRVVQLPVSSALAEYLRRECRAWGP